MGLFHMDSAPVLNTRNLGNSPRFLPITHMTMSAKRFGCYGILTINVTNEFCFWTEQRLNRT
jgi:hypothetical protein